MAEQSVQDKNVLPEEIAILLRRRYYEFLQRSWWLEPMPVYSWENMPNRVEYARRMTARDGNGDPVWAGAVMHLTEQVAGAPFSIEGPESAVDKTIALMNSAPGGYREMMKMITNGWVISDVGPCVEVIYTAPRRIRDGVTTKPVPERLDIFDPSRIRLVAPKTKDYPYAYRTTRVVDNRLRPPGWEALFRQNEIPLHKSSVRQIVNLPQTEEGFFGCGVSPTALFCYEWQITMGSLGLLLDDATNMAAYTILVGRNLNADQIQAAMEDRAERIARNDNNPLASALMLFGENDLVLGSDNGPSIQGVPLRRYPEQWNWRFWLEERIQLASTILGVSPMSMIMSIYARANQAGAQYAADESGVRRSSMLVGLGDIWDGLAGMYGATFTYRSHRIADREREFTVFGLATKAWADLYMAANNTIPLLADTAEEAAARVRQSMVEQKLISPTYAEGERTVKWDTTDGNTPGAANATAKMMAYIAAAARRERWVEVAISPDESQTRYNKTVIGTCKLRDSLITSWRGWSAGSIKRLARLQQLREDWRTPPPVLKEGGGRAPRSAPRRMREHQDAWEAELQRLLDELRVNLQAPWNSKNKDRLLQLIDHWQENAQKEAVVAVDPAKAAAAQAMIEEAYQAVERSDERRMAILLALLLFADGLQRRGESFMREALTVLGLDADGGAAAAMTELLERHGAYVIGSLTPDLVDFWRRNERLPASLQRRALVWYGGALWSAMQKLIVADAPYGMLARIDGPVDENNCLASDPGAGFACADIVGRTYVIGVEHVPELGIETKCGQACRHYVTIMPASGAQ